MQAEVTHGIRIRGFGFWGGEMIPDKPGYWWYLPIRGEAKIAYLAKWYAPYLCVVEEKIIGIHQFESQSNFKQWLGPAYPPKKVKSFECRHGRTTYCDTRKAVLLDDVKEYLLEEQ
jgi:hypothetical protein